MKINSSNDIRLIFSLDAIELEQSANLVMQKINLELNELYSIEKTDRTYENTILTIDALLHQIESERMRLYVLSSVHTEKEIRDASQKLLNILYEFNLTSFCQNKKLYEIVKDYYNHKNKFETNHEVKIFLDKLLKIFNLAGLDLNLDQQNLLKEKYCNLNAKCLKFGETINKSIILDFQLPELSGLNKEFLEKLTKIDADTYQVNLNYPTYCAIIENCSVENTRKKIWLAFQNRGYPENVETLEKIIETRKEIAKILGYNNYADLDISDQMAKTPENVEIFLKKVGKLFSQKAKIEKEEIFKNNKIKPWDIEFILKKNSDSKSNLAIKEYFPTQHVLTKMLELYSKFFGVNFKLDGCPDLWAENLFLVAVTKKNNKLLGYIILDLFSRPNKYSHARHCNIIPAQKNANNRSIALSLVIANISPDLLTHDEVAILFHEFGHAIHAVLGATQLAYLSGTRVLTDFLEMPSLMLEEWIWDRQVLKKISKHYKTGEPLSDELINQMIEHRFKAVGYWGERQIFLSLFSLYCYSNIELFDIKKLFDELYSSTISYVDNDEHNHFYSSFTQIATYGSKYYSYMWAQVYASDIFKFIKDHDFLNSEIGSDYTKKVIEPGGSIDPLIILESFLGRVPNEKSFFEILKLENSK